MNKPSRPHYTLKDSARLTIDIMLNRVYARPDVLRLSPERQREMVSLASSIKWVLIGCMLALLVTGGFGVATGHVASGLVNLVAGVSLPVDLAVGLYLMGWFSRSKRLI